jgi:hypothetical protein
MTNLSTFYNYHQTASALVPPTQQTAPIQNSQSIQNVQTTPLIIDTSGIKSMKLILKLRKIHKVISYLNDLQMNKFNPQDEKTICDDYKKIAKLPQHVIAYYRSYAEKYLVENLSKHIFCIDCVNSLQLVKDFFVSVVKISYNNLNYENLIKQLINNNCKFKCDIISLFLNEFPDLD